jgi:hypothetical protein
MQLRFSDSQRHCWVQSNPGIARGCVCEWVCELTVVSQEKEGLFLRFRTTHLYNWERMSTSWRGRKGS